MNTSTKVKAAGIAIVLSGLVFLEAGGEMEDAVPLRDAPRRDTTVWVASPEKPAESPTEPAPVLMDCSSITDTIEWTECKWNNHSGTLSRLEWEYYKCLAGSRTICTIPPNAMSTDLQSLVEDMVEGAIADHLG